MNSGSSNVINASVADCFKKMDISLGKESTDLAKLWLQKHKVISGYADGIWISNSWLEEHGAASSTVCQIIDRQYASKLCDVSEVNFSNNFIAELKNLALSGFEEWTRVSASSKSECLYKVAKYIEECQQLFAEIECVSAKKSISRVKSKDIPCLIDSFYYNAGCALLLEEPNVLYPIGCVCLINDKYSLPSLSLSLQISSLLAAGNSVLLLADAENCLSGCFLAEICTKAGIPKNVFNVIPYGRNQNPLDDRNMFFEKELYSGCHEASCCLAPRRSIAIIYEKADLHAAAESVLESFVHCNPESKAGGCKVLIQQSIYETFLDILEDAFSKVNVGSTWSDSDLLLTEKQSTELLECIKEASVIGKVYKLSSYERPSKSHIQPAILSGIPSSFKLVHKELGGPIIVAVSFRTVKESISMFNCDNAGSPVSIWSEIMSIALEVSNMLKTCTIWINSQHVFHASVPFYGICGRGNCIVGGKEEFFSHLKSTSTSDSDISDAGPDIHDCPAVVKDDKYKEEYKLFINGEQKKSSSYAVFRSSLIWKASKADLELAVSCALAAQPSWQIITRSKKRDILLSIAKNLEMQKEDFVSLLSYGMSKDASIKEVNDSVKILYRWALSDGYDGETKDISRNMKVMQMRCPLGVIVLDCPRKNPLLAFLALVAPAIIFGNTIVCVLSHYLPEPVLRMCEVFKLCGVPKGVINVLYCENLLRSYSHKNVSAVWFTDNSFSYSEVRYSIFDNVSDYFNEAVTLKCVMAATFTKSVFLPFGDIFSN